MIKEIIIKLLITKESIAANKGLCLLHLEFFKEIFNASNFKKYSDDSLYSNKVNSTKSLLI